MIFILKLVMFCWLLTALINSKVNILFKFIQSFFSSLSGVLDFFRTKNDQEAGANKVLVKQNDKRNKIRKDSDRVWDGDDRNRMQRTPGKGRK